MDIQVGQVIAGFKVTQVSDVKEVCGSAYVMEHIQSAAKLVCLKNQDPELAFSISFSTPAADDTGVFHILEHSMLCGSKRYPLKEPFTAMLKSSMKTYLNAFTGPDYTMYPVATANAQDLLNLMDVYMDAVLNPLLLEDESIFLQEGWHLECDGSATSLAVSGVVYNEMKGAKSTPVRGAVDAVKRALFSQGTYGYDSGGDPASITSLSYQAFCDAYRRHYRLDNAIITLYGDIDVCAVLEHLDTHHLVPWLASHPDQGAFGSANTLQLTAPRLAMSERATFKGGPESSILAFGSVLGGPLDILRTTAAGVICDALFGDVEAPLHKLLLESGICGEAVACNMAGSAQPYVLVAALSAQEEDRQRFLDLIASGCEDVLASGKLPELVDATVSVLEFAWREGPKEPCGISFAQDVRTCWPYGIDPLACTRYEEFLAWHDQAKDSGVYESLVRELFIDCKHAACVALVPDMDLDAFGERAYLEGMAASLSKDDLDRIARDAQDLKQRRLAADSPDALATLPRLNRADLPPLASRPKTDTVTSKGTHFVRLLEPSHGIDYVEYYFDLSGFSLEDVQCLSLLCSLAGELSVGDMSAAQVAIKIKETLGQTDCDIVTLTRWNDFAPLAFFKLGFSALGAKRQAAHEFFWSLFTGSNFDDTAKVAQVIDLLVVGFEQTAASRAASLVMPRAAASSAGALAVNDAVEGIGSYRFLKGLAAQSDKSALCAKLKRLSAQICSMRPVLVSFAGDDAGFKLAQESAPCFAPQVADAAPVTPYDIKLAPATREGFALPVNVAANATYMNPPLTRHETGYDSLLEQALNWGYLWNHVRVKGGAYGCSGLFTARGTLNLLSLSDPRIDGTYDDFHEACSWLAAHEFTQDEVDGFVISVIGASDKPRKVATKVTREAHRILRGRPLASQDAARAQILQATPQNLHDYAQILLDYKTSGSLATIASREMLAASNEVEQVCDLLD